MRSNRAVGLMMYLYHLSPLLCKLCPVISASKLLLGLMGEMTLNDLNIKTKTFANQRSSCRTEAVAGDLVLCAVSEASDGSINGVVGHEATFLRPSADASENWPAGAGNALEVLQNIDRLVWQRDDVIRSAA